MAMRTCPLCLAKVPSGKIVACSNDLECPGCRARLDVAPASRHLSIAVGLVVAAGVFHFADKSGEMLGWVLPLVYAFLALGFISPVVLMLLADLRAKPAEAVAEQAHTATDSGPVHSTTH